MTADRAGYTAGLRALADLLDTHPEVPLPYDGSAVPLTIHHLYARDPERTVREEFQATLRALPGRKDKAPDGTYFDVEFELHGLKLTVTAFRDDVCERVVTGTREVTREVPDPDALAAVPTTTITETVEDVTWECRPLLAPAEAYEAVEWGVEVWPDTDSPYNRVDPCTSREQAEHLLQVAYGSAARLVCREPGQPWRVAAKDESVSVDGGVS